MAHAPKRAVPAGSHDKVVHSPANAAYTVRICRLKEFELRDTASHYAWHPDGPRLSCNVEGTDGASITIADGPAEISLQTATPVRVASIYLKE